MEALDPNGECGRSKPQKRKTLAWAFVHPRTVKLLLALMPWTIKLITMIIELVRSLRN